MAEFKVFGDDNTPKENTGQKKSGKLKKLFKKKPFLIAVAVVVVLGLLAWYKKSQVPQTTSDESSMVVADGLEVMYPSSDTYMSSEGTYIVDVIDGMVDSFDAVISGMETEHENEMIQIQDIFNSEMNSLRETFDVTVDSMSMQIDSMSDKIDTQSNTLVQQSNTIARQNAIKVMQNNSDAWHYATSDAERESLQKANEQIASQWGWERDDDGYWYEDGELVYSTTTQNVVNTSSTPSTKNLSSGTTTKSSSGSSSSSKSSSSTASDIATMKANSQAWHTASDSQKTALHNQNQAIAKKNGWTYDSGSGTYSDKNGNRVY